MVQIFAFFADRLGAAKINLKWAEKTCDVIHVFDWHGCGLYVEKARKLKPQKFLLKG
jgi:hypothetical protein